MSYLTLKNLTVSYGAIQALHGISLDIEEGEIITLLGANGAGKSTSLRAISRINPVAGGEILFKGRSLLNIQPHEVVSMGIAHVPEGRGVFASLSVLENLKLAGWTVKSKQRLKELFHKIYQLFPRLSERSHQAAGTLSGGEQQMLAVARALMTDCRLLLLDEPSMGLSPLLVKEVFKAIKEVNHQGVTVLLVEQNANMALKIAHRGYVLETGRLVLSGPAKDLSNDPRVKDAYLGKHDPSTNVNS